MDELQPTHRRFRLRSKIEAVSVQGMPHRFLAGQVFVSGFLCTERPELASTNVSPGEAIHALIIRQHRRVPQCPAAFEVDTDLAIKIDLDARNRQVGFRVEHAALAWGDLVASAQRQCNRDDRV